MPGRPRPTISPALVFCVRKTVWKIATETGVKTGAETSVKTGAKTGVKTAEKKKALLFFRRAFFFTVPPLSHKRAPFFSPQFSHQFPHHFSHQFPHAPVFKPVSVAIFHTVILTKNTTRTKLFANLQLRFCSQVSNLFVNAHLHPHHQKMKLIRNPM